MVTQLSILEAQPFLRGMAGAQLAELAKACQHVTVPAGHRLFVFDAASVRAACSTDPVLGYELGRRFSAVVVRRLQATRARLIEHAANQATSTESGMSHV